MKQYFLSLCLFLTLLACQTEPTAEFIINKSIEASGGSLYEHSKIKFNFREKQYKVERNNGAYSMQRITNKDTLIVSDVLSNDGFARIINDSLTIVSDSMADKYSESINSVFYFALLPYRLNDEAVHKKFLGKVSIAEKEYYKIEVSFTEKGGGIDFQDVYIYWINTENYKIDYLAYSFIVNGGGMRFRKAYNEQIVGGIRFVDYINYKPTATINSVHDLDKAFLNNELKELSRIELKNIKVTTQL